MTTKIAENAPWLPMVIECAFQVEKVDGSRYRLDLYPVNRGGSDVALRVSSASPIEVESIQAVEGLEGMGPMRFIRHGDLGEGWDITHKYEGGDWGDSVEVANLFHRCWTHALASPDYNKNEWNELRQVFDRLGYRI